MNKYAGTIPSIHYLQEKLRELKITVDKETESKLENLVNNTIDTLVEQKVQEKLEALFPNAPEEGTFILTSVDGELIWEEQN